MAEIEFDLDLGLFLLADFFLATMVVLLEKDG
jgi:hypothetical protein